MTSRSLTVRGSLLAAFDMLRTPCYQGHGNSVFAPVWVARFPKRSGSKGFVDRTKPAKLVLSGFRATREGVKAITEQRNARDLLTALGINVDKVLSGAVTDKLQDSRTAATVAFGCSILEVCLDTYPTLFSRDNRFVARWTQSFLQFLSGFVGMPSTQQVAAFKAFFAWSFAFHLRQTDKDQIKGLNLKSFGGVFSRWLRKRLLDRTKRGEHFALSLLNAKRGCNPVPDDFISDQLAKHACTLSHPPDPLPPVVLQFIDTATSFLLKGFHLDITRTFDDPLEASPAASYERGMGLGGGREELVARLSKGYLTRVLSEIEELTDITDAAINAAPPKDLDDSFWVNVRVGIGGYREESLISVRDFFLEKPHLLVASSVERHLAREHGRPLAERTPVVRYLRQFEGIPKDDTTAKLLGITVQELLKIADNTPEADHRYVDTNLCICDDCLARCAEEVISDPYRTMAFSESAFCDDNKPQLPLPFQGMVETMPGRVEAVYHRSTISGAHIRAAAAVDSWDKASWKVHPVLEPLKVRVITKGPATTQWLLRRLQKAVHSHLRKNVVFAALDHPIEEADISSFVASVQNLEADTVHNARYNALTPQWKRAWDQKLIGHASGLWNSGDYSAATDGLNIHVTQRILQSVLERCHGTREDKELFDRLANRIVGESYLLYSGDQVHQEDLVARQVPGDPEQHHDYHDGKDYYQVDQKNGQLMGSILSFPILCIANFAAQLLWAYRTDVASLGCDVWSSKWSTPEISKGSKGIPIAEFTPRMTAIANGACRINGDDVLVHFKHADEYPLWTETVHMFGFEKSVGKNYVDPKVLMINSELFRYSTANDLVERIRYMNVGLLTGQSKVTGRLEQRTRPVASILDEVLEGSLTPCRSLARFLFYNRDSVVEVTGRRVNLFVPRMFGGLGVRPRGVRFTINAAQRRVAAYCRYKQMHGLPIAELRTYYGQEFVTEPDAPHQVADRHPEYVTFKLVEGAADWEFPEWPSVYSYPPLSTTWSTERERTAANWSHHRVWDRALKAKSWQKLSDGEIFADYHYERMGSVDQSPKTGSDEAIFYSSKPVPSEPVQFVIVDRNDGHIDPDYVAVSQPELHDLEIAAAAAAPRMA